MSNVSCLDSLTMIHLIDLTGLIDPITHYPGFPSGQGLLMESVTGGVKIRSGYHFAPQFNTPAPNVSSQFAPVQHATTQPTIFAHPPAAAPASLTSTGSGTSLASLGLWNLQQNSSNFAGDSHQQVHEHGVGQLCKKPIRGSSL